MSYETVEYMTPARSRITEIIKDFYVIMSSYITIGQFKISTNEFRQGTIDISGVT